MIKLITIFNLLHLAFAQHFPKVAQNELFLANDQLVNIKNKMFSVPKELKIGHLTDIHLKLDYNKWFSLPKEFCSSKDDHNQTDTSQAAFLGRNGCDPPKELLHYILQLLKTQSSEEPLDFILLTGDLLAHCISYEPKCYNNETEDQSYKNLQHAHTQVAQILREHFSNIPIFITFGNNDCKYHNDAPHLEEKQEFYEFMYNLWFRQHPANQQFMSQELHETFINGGYYRINLTDKLSLLSLNTLPWNIRDKSNDTQVRQDQMKWLTENIQNGDQKFIIFDHIYAGYRIEGEGDIKKYTWNPEYQSQYFDLLQKNEGKLLLEVAGHDHWFDLRVLTSLQTHNNYRPLMIGESISPFSNSTPGFSTFKVDSGASNVFDLQTTYLDIESLLGKTTYPSVFNIQRNQIDFSKDQDLPQLSSDSIFTKLKFMQSQGIENQILYLSQKIGFNETTQKSKDLIIHYGLVNSDGTNAKNYFCMALSGQDNVTFTECMNQK